MTPEDIVGIFREALMVSMILVSVIIIPSLLVGLVVATFQAATQINEQTLSFLPRFLITLGVLAVYGPWLGGLVYEFTESLILEIPHLIG